MRWGGERGRLKHHPPWNEVVHRLFQDSLQHLGGEVLEELHMAVVKEFLHSLDDREFGGFIIPI